MTRHRIRAKVTKSTKDIPQSRSLFAAVYGSDVRTVRRLVVKEGVPVNVVDADDPLGPTPLLVACERQYYKVIQALFKAKPKSADINCENKHGKRPIWWACRYGDKDLTKLIVEDSSQDCDVNYNDKETGCTPLYRAILSGSHEVCRILIRGGADVNLRRIGQDAESSSTESPLMKAVQMGNKAIADTLINSLCVINARTDEGLTALHYAVTCRRYAICKQLLRAKIKVHVETLKGSTAMTFAIYYYLPTMCKLLAQYKYDVDRLFRWGESPLEMAIKCHSEDCAMTLVYFGCNLLAEEGKPSFFRMAAYEGLFTLVKLLVEIRPLFLNESWVKNQQLPLPFYSNTEQFDWLVELSAQPRSLYVLCKNKIVKVLGKSWCNKIKRLPLPKKIIKELKLRQFFHRDFFCEKTLETDDCPYECESSCSKSQCYPIDFTDSESD